MKERGQDVGVALMADDQPPVGQQPGQRPPRSQGQLVLITSP
jgi:hypothetical protein